MYNYGIGGFFTGIYLNIDECSWQEDTIYILYTKGLKSRELISVSTKDGFLGINSSMSKELRIYGNNLNGELSIEQEDNLKSEMFNTLQSGRVNYVVFLRIEDNFINVIMMNKRMVTDFLKIDSLGPNEFKLSISNPLMVKLNLIQEDMEDDSIPFFFDIFSGMRDEEV